MDTNDKKRLTDPNVPTNITKLCNNFLTDRHDHHSGAMRVYTRFKSRTIPLLLLMDTWFKALDETETLDENDMVQAIEYDQIIIISGTSLHKLESKRKNIWIACEAWANKNQLTYNKAKTMTMFIPYKRIRDPRQEIGDTSLVMGNTMVYLRVTLDAGLFWREHVRDTRKNPQIFQTIFFISREETGVESQKS